MFQSRTRYLNPFTVITIGILCSASQTTVVLASPAKVTFEKQDGSVQIQIGDAPFARYVYHDKDIQRPYFCDVYAPGGTQVTRNHPPIEGVDRTDHATYHPGLWLTFGDISGADFWRNRARTRHVEWIQEPTGGDATGRFAVRNQYLSSDGEKVICEEVCRYSILVRPVGYLILWDSEFFSDGQSFWFGDQEEMGLGVRIATPISAEKGGEILSSAGTRNEKEVWGKQAAWCSYSGVIEGRYVGVTLMPAPGNFRPSWFHARDYGLLVANPFGRNAFTEAEKSRITVRNGDRFRLGFGVLVHGAQDSKEVDIQVAYDDYLKVRKN